MRITKLIINNINIINNNNNNKIFTNFLYLSPRMTLSKFLILAVRRTQDACHNHMNLL